MQVASILALWLGFAQPADAVAPPSGGANPSPPELPALDLPPIEQVDNPLVVPPPPAASNDAAPPPSDSTPPPTSGGSDPALRPVEVNAGGDPSAKGRRHRLEDRKAIARLRLIDLRDPFERRGPSGGVHRVLSARLILPDLKDPFAVKRRPRPKNWSVPDLPADIRDPFANGAIGYTGKPGCAPIRTKTESGVTIQRPNAAKKREQEEAMRREQECAEIQQHDLRDPFGR